MDTFATTFVVDFRCGSKMLTVRFCNTSEHDLRFQASYLLTVSCWGSFSTVTEERWPISNIFAKEFLMSDETEVPRGNPAVVGLGGFGLTMIIQQLHHLGLCGLGPFIACGLVFGGLAQFIVGFAEQKCGNNFSYAVFTAYGAFWITYCIILLFDKFAIYHSSTSDIGYFLIVWTIYTVILWIASLYINGAMSCTFTMLVLGFILLDLGQFGYPAMSKVAAYVLIFGALIAWYIMAHVIFLGIFGRDVLPLGDPWLNHRPAV